MSLAEMTSHPPPPFRGRFQLGMKKFALVGLDAMKEQWRDRETLCYAEVVPPTRVVEDSHVSPSRTVCLASRTGQPLPPAAALGHPGLGPVDTRPHPGPPRRLGGGQPPVDAAAGPRL